MQIETTFTAAQLQRHLRQLYAERSLAEVAGLTANPGYMADLIDDITAYEEAFVGVAITEIATCAPSSAACCRAEPAARPGRRRAGARLSSNARLARSGSVELSGPRARGAASGHVSRLPDRLEEFAVTGGLYRLGRVCVRHAGSCSPSGSSSSSALAIGRAAWAPISATTSSCRAPTARRRPTSSTTASRPGERDQPGRPGAPEGHEDHRRQVRGRGSTPRSRRCARTPTSARRRARCRRQARRRCPRAGPSATSRSTRRPAPSDMTTDDAQRIVDWGIRPRRRVCRSAFGSYIGQKVSKPDDARQRGHRAGDGRDRPAVHVRDRRRDGPADHHRADRARVRALDHHVHQPRRRRPDRRADAGDDDRPGRRDRLRAVHRHAAHRAAPRRHGHDGVHRPVDRDVRRRGRVRRDDGDHRAAVAGRRRHPARHDARLHRGARRARSR